MHIFKMEAFFLWQGKNTDLIFEDSMEGTSYYSTARFRTKYIIQSKMLKSSKELAETEAAVEVYSTVCRPASQFKYGIAYRFLLVTKGTEKIRLECGGHKKC